VRTRIAISAGLVALCAATFLAVPSLPFLSFDDPEYLTANPHLAGGLGADTVAWALTTGHAANWHPVTWLSHALDVSLFGLWPPGHHAVNLALHALGALLLFLAVARLTGSTWRSALVAALFALHPLRVESVAWVSERKDLLGGLFWFATMLAYERWARRPSPARYAAVTALFALGLASKPMLVTLPFALLLLDAWPLGRLDLAHPSPRALWPLVREKLPLLALSAAASAITLAAQSSWGSTRPLAGIPLADRLANAVVAVVLYLVKTLWPSSLAVFYPYPVGGHGALRVAAAGATIAALTAGALLLRRRFPSLAVGWLWFLGTLVPVLGIVQVGNQAMADRYTYVPGVGLALAVAFALPDAKRSRATAAAAAAAIAALAVATAVQVSRWSSERELFEHAARVTEGNWLAATVIGMDLERRGDRAGAIARYREAVGWNPRAPEALNNLGNALTAEGRLDEGIGYLREAVRAWPGHLSALSNLGAALAEAGRAAEAVPYLAQAAARAPDHAGIRYNHGLALLDAGRPAEAVTELEAAVRLSPGDPQARAWLERARAAQGR